MKIDIYLLSVIVVMTIATFTTRAASFLLLRQGGKHPTLLYLGHHLPPAVMMLLVIYSIKDVPILSPPHGLPYWIAIAATAGVHIWRRNALLSIAIGTGLFMWLQQAA